MKFKGIIITLLVFVSIVFIFPSDMNASETDKVEPIEIEELEEVNKEQEDSQYEENPKSKTYTTQVTTDSDVDKTSETNEEVKELEEESVEEDSQIQSRALNSNEILVDSFNELVKLVRNKGNGIYDTYYFAADLTVSTEITVPLGYDFTINGTNPETGNRHKLYLQTGTAYNFSLRANSTNSVVFKDLDIEGDITVTRGVLYAPATATASKVLFDNINFVGPVFATPGTAEVKVKDSSITQRTAVNSYNRYIYTGTNLTIEGNTKIHSIGQGNGTLLSLTTSTIKGSLVVDFGANFEIVSDKPIVYGADLIQVNDGATFTTDLYKGVTAMATMYNARQIVFQNATINVVSNEGLDLSILFYSVSELQLTGATMNVDFESMGQILRFEGNASVEKSNFNINGKQFTSFGSLLGGQIKSNLVVLDSTIKSNVESMSFHLLNAGYTLVISNTTIEHRGDVVRGTFMEAQDIQITDNSNIVVDLATGSANDLIRGVNSTTISDSDLDIKIRDSYVTSGRDVSLIDTKVLTITDGRIYAEINDAEFAYMFDVSERMDYTDTGTKPSYLTVQSISTFRFMRSTTAKVSIQAQQFNTWGSIPNIDFIPNRTQMPQQRFRNEDYSIGAMSFKMNAGGLADFTINDFDKGEASLSLDNIRVLSIGNLVTDFNDQSALEKFTGVSNPNANIRLQYNKNEVADGNASSNGIVDMTLNPQATGGIFAIEVFSTYLYREDIADYTRLGSLDLIEYPSSLEFGTLEIPKSHTVFNRTNKVRFVVKDTRYDPVGWKLEARLKTKLSDPLGIRTPLDDALVFKQTPTDVSVVLSSTPSLIHMASGEYGIETELEFEIDEGILLELYGPASIYKDVQYKAEIEWILTPLS